MSVNLLNQSHYPNSKNPNSLQDGLEYQDWIQKTALAEWGMVIQINSSKLYQLQFGESIQQTEVKLDTRCSETGNLSVEIEERSSTKIEKWTSSGIYAYPPSIFYIQGNYEVFYLFETKRLQEIHRVLYRSAYLEFNGTIRKFHLPLKVASENAIRKWVKPNPNQMGFRSV